ncbi:MAG: hypothetical protein EBV97_09820 [Rhodobacteraceae bacterium]|nr:hypothetical protein [Paracoccaceae bacterium]
MNSLAIIILAAGKSSRMRGKDKLTQRVRGEPQLRRIVCAACETCPNVFITLPDVAHPRATYRLFQFQKPTSAWGALLPQQSQKSRTRRSKGR